MNILKQGIAEPESRAADAEVRQTVEGILHDVEARGDAAVRDYSARFDGWSPESFRLSAADVAAIVSRVSPAVIHDITFAQDQIRRFAC